LGPGIPGSEFWAGPHAPAPASASDVLNRQGAKNAKATDVDGMSSFPFPTGSPAALSTRVGTRARGCVLSWPLAGVRFVLA